MTAPFYKRTHCRMCDGTALVEAMRLTPTPPGNTLRHEDELALPETLYPLELHFCRDCHHVQLGHVVDPRILYQNDYLYVSGTSAHFVKHLAQYASDMVRRFALPSGALVADIGSNDGTALRFFKEHGMTVVGVDPATEIAATATNAGIPTVNDFFSADLARDLRVRYGPAAFITSHNACAHIDHLDDVMRGVTHWLDDDGVFVLEVGYFVDVFSNLFFDTIYHEHLDYHTVAPFKRLFARTGLELLRVERVSPQGGSIRVMAQKAGGRRRPDATIDELMGLEERLGLDRPETLAAFGAKIETLGERLRQLLCGLRRDGKTIAAYGAPTKAVTLLSHFRIGADLLDFVVEDNPLKHGLFLPVSHIPVVPTEELYRRRPDYTLILAWNFAEPIMAMHRRYVEAGGRFIVPMPEPAVV
jgi:SAM-dependent methyltransferase